ncbi:MAG: hypothetical protein IKK66_10150 [Ruminococcus sp.]|nr:hypothetical protein [Ruminococcus sp.]
MKTIKKITAVAMALVISTASTGMTAYADNVDVNVSTVNIVAEGEEQESQILTRTMGSLEITINIEKNEVKFKDIESNISMEIKDNSMYFDGTIIESMEEESDYQATEEDFGFILTAFAILATVQVDKIVFTDNVIEINEGIIDGDSTFSKIALQFGENIQSITPDLINSPDMEITVYGYKGTAAETYAADNNYPFIALDETSSTDNKGDVNTDGTVDSSDASLVLAEYAKVQTGETLTFTDVQAESADVNIDGVIDASDASKILAYYSAVSTGKTPSWT